MRKIIIPVLLSISFVACQSSTTESAEVDSSEAKETIIHIDSTKFIHSVFFWLNEDVSDEQRLDFETNGLNEIAKIESIYKLYYGPAAMTDRDVVDNSYDYAWICHFKSAEDEKLYQDDPVHLKFIEDYKHLWKDVKVYDNLVTN